MNNESAAFEEVSARKALQDILYNRIMQKKGEIHECHNKVYNENLWREIETLHWVWAQILTLKREYTTLNSRSSSNNNNHIGRTAWVTRTIPKKFFRIVHLAHPLKDLQGHREVHSQYY
jgi:hypothetical protein